MRRDGAAGSPRRGPRGLISPLETVIEPGLLVLGDLDYAAFALAEDGPVLAAAGHRELVTCCRAALYRARAGGYDAFLRQEMLRLLDDLARITGTHLSPPAAPARTDAANAAWRCDGSPRSLGHPTWRTYRP